MDNFYFSLSLGDKFHARALVVEQMNNPHKMKLFWQLLEHICLYNINLELVLNNGNILKTDVEQARQMLNEYGIKINFVGITDDIFEIVKAVFPNQKIIYS